MEIRFNVAKEERKVLVQAVGEIEGRTPIYKKAPGFEYVVHNCIIDRHGTLIYDERTDEADVRHLLSELSARGFVYEGFGGSIDGDLAANAETEHSEDNTPERLSIEVPIAGFTHTALDNLDKLVTGKAALIMKAIGSDALPIERQESSLCFPWFNLPVSPAELDAYTRLIHTLCEMAKKQTRVTMKEKAVGGEGSEKFAFRTFLLRLGFIGAEYASARKVLLSRLSGSGSFKNGDHKDRDACKGLETADNSGESEVVVTGCDDDCSANNGLTGGYDAEMVSEVTVHG